MKVPLVRQNAAYCNGLFGRISGCVRASRRVVRRAIRRDPRTARRSGHCYLDGLGRARHWGCPADPPYAWAPCESGVTLAIWTRSGLAGCGCSRSHGSVEIGFKFGRVPAATSRSRGRAAGSIVRGCREEAFSWLERDAGHACDATTRHRCRACGSVERNGRRARRGRRRRGRRSPTACRRDWL